MEGRITKIEEDIKTIKENHLAHIETDINALKVDTAKQGVHLEWLINNHWRITMGLIMTFLASIIGAIISYL